MLPTLPRLLAPHAGRFALAAAASAASDLAAVGLMATATWLIARAAEQPPLAALSLAIVAVRALALARGVFRYAERLTGHAAALRTLADIRGRVYDALVRQAPAGLPAFREADLLSRVVADVDAVQELVLRCLIPASVAAAVTAAAGGLCWALLPGAGLALVAGLVTGVLLVPGLAAVISRRASGRVADERAALAAHSVDLVRGAADLAAYGASGAALGRAEDTTHRLADLERSNARTAGAATAAVLLVQGLTAVAVTVLAVRAVAAGTLDAVLLPVLALTSLAAFEVVVPLPAAASRWVQSRAAVRRLTAVLDAPPPVAEPHDAVPAPRGPVTLWLSGVRARHAPDRPPALDGVDLSLPPGRRVALVGASGSGKSTLLAVLLRFVDIEAGRVTADGVDLAAYAGDDVRRVVRGVTQDAHVFHASIRENLRLARPDASQHQLAAAARRVRLLDWIEGLPEGWETVVGEDGGLLSGGQRQRLLLARVLLADPPVLVLDEPTEGLDAMTAAAVLADILDATHGRTVLLVTHVLTGLDAVDEVVVMDTGRVVQRGPHYALLGEPGPYREMWETERLGDLRLPSAAPAP